MNRIAIAAIVGIVAAAALAGAYFGAPYAGLHLSATMAMVIAGIMAFGASTSAFTMVALHKPGEKKKPAPSTRFNDPLALQFIHPFRAPGGLQIEMRPNSTAEEHDIYKHPSSYADKPILVVLKKGSGKTVFNPVVLKQLFVLLKPFAQFDHILLVNEHDEFVGYIPALQARTAFVGANAESSITKYIIAILAEPTTSSILREINGLSTEEMISDNDTVARATTLIFGGLKRGLVICRSGRSRKPFGIIFAEDLHTIAAHGA